LRFRAPFGSINDSQVQVASGQPVLGPLSTTLILLGLRHWARTAFNFFLDL
jgi:hypothetical protein